MADEIVKGVILNAMWAMSKSLRKQPTRYDRLLAGQKPENLVGLRIFDDTALGATLDKGAEVIPGTLQLPNFEPTFDLKDFKTRYQKFNDGLLGITGQLGESYWAFPVFSDPPLESGKTAMRGIAIKSDFVKWTDVPYNELLVAYLNNVPESARRGLPFDPRNFPILETAAHFWGRKGEWCTGIPNMHEQKYDDGVVHFGVYQIHQDATIPRYRNDLVGFSAECRNCLSNNPGSHPALGAAGARQLAQACYSLISDNFAGAIPVSRDQDLEIRFIRSDRGTLFEVHPSIIECFTKVPAEVFGELGEAFTASQNLEFLPYGALAVPNLNSAPQSRDVIPYDVGLPEERDRKKSLAEGFGLDQIVNLNA